MTEKSQQTRNGVEKVNDPFGSLIELDAALQKMGGKKQLFANMAKRFIQEAGNILKNISSNIQRGRLVEAADLLHAYKGMSGSVGAQQAHEQSVKIEAQLRKSGVYPNLEEDIALLHRLSTESLAQLQTIEADLRKAETTGSGADGSGEGKKPAVDAFGSIIEPSSGKPRLLFVDDQASNMGAIFKDDYEINMAKSGAAALTFCQNQQPDLILMNVVMPDMDGYEVCRRLKGNFLTRDIPVIFMTSKNDPAEEVSAFESGGIDFVAKPFNEEVIKARIRAHVTLKRQADMLRSMALIDGLTRVANRRYFDSTLQAEWRRCSRDSHPLALMLADVDYFKLYNSHYGHQAGDICLQLIATALRAGLGRSHDMVARFGGEKFACILPDTPLPGARKKAEDLEKAVRELAILHEKSSIAKVVTISLGVAVAYPSKGQSSEQLIALAEDQLYLAKQAGRGTMRYSTLMP